MKILEKRDKNYDFVRAGLVFGMVVYHAFGACGVDEPIFFRATITLGFVLLSGFTIGALYTPRIKRDPRKYSSILMRRGMKLLLMYLALNAVIFAVHPMRMRGLADGGPDDLFRSLLLITDQSKIAFDILVPIGATSLFSIFVLKRIPDRFLSTAAFGLASVFACIKIFDIFNYYSIKLLLIGLMGTILGKVVLCLDWDVFLKKMQERKGLFILLPFLAIYYTFALWKYDYFNVMGLHVFPVLVALFNAYFISYSFDLMDIPFLRSTAAALSENLLFAYFFHILFLRAFLVVLGMGSMSLAQAMLLSCAVFSVTIFACMLNRKLTAASTLYRNSYGLFFKL